MSRAQDALSALQLLAAMYPMDGELALSDGAAAALASAEAGDPPDLSRPLELVVRIPLDGDDADRKHIDLAITLCVNDSDGAAVRLAPRQPSFLLRSAFETLEEGMPTAEGAASDAVMTAIDYLSAATPPLICEPDIKPASPKADEDDGPLERVWFWFPSLSTREKRKDLVNYASSYRLTGFVLSGKPALLCLEGGGRAVDRYMAAIKSESWGDIPSYQKKVTERLRLPLLPSERKFTTMTDITALIPHYGTYNHRGDMSEVKRLMDEWGVGNDFGAAVMNARDD